MENKIKRELSAISKRLLEAKNLSGLSYPEIEKRTGISKSALQRYITGETSKIPLESVELIANATGVSAAYIMGWVDSEKENESNRRKNAIDTVAIVEGKEIANFLERSLSLSKDSFSKLFLRLEELEELEKIRK